MFLISEVIFSEGKIASSQIGFLRKGLLEAGEGIF